MDLPSAEGLRPGADRPRTDCAATQDGVQGAGDIVEAESEPRQTAAPCGQADTKPPEPAAGGSQDSPLLTADSATEGAGIFDQAPQAQQADDPPATEEQTTASNSSAEEELIRNWPTLDKPDSGLRSHAPMAPLVADSCPGWRRESLRHADWPEQEPSLGIFRSSRGSNPDCRLCAGDRHGRGRDQSSRRAACRPDGRLAAGARAGQPRRPGCGLGGC
jgi:hypothetical protein